MTQQDHIADADAPNDGDKDTKAKAESSTPLKAHVEDAGFEKMDFDDDASIGAQPTPENEGHEESEAPEEEKSTTSLLIEKALKLLPWMSLFIAILSAFIMDRSPKSAWMVVTAATLGWAAIIGFGLLSPLDPEKFEGKKRLLVKAAALLSLVVTQSLMQQCLFFSIPFYMGAMSFRAAHIAFVTALLAAAAITMWDPLYEKFMANSALRFILQSLAIFAGLNVVIPVMGVANSTSLFISALVAGIGIPLQGWVGIQRENLPSTGKVTGFWRSVQWDVFGVSREAVRLDGKRGKIARTQLAATVAAMMFPVVIVNFSAPLIPPAPLRLVHAELATTLHKSKMPQAPSIEHIPSELNCMTWISAPRGVHEKLYHVWRRNGFRRDRIPLVIRGGNKGGFRTNSRKQRLTPDPKGVWTCSVETEAGQFLGETSIEIK